MQKKREARVTCEPHFKEPEESKKIAKTGRFSTGVKEPLSRQDKNTKPLGAEDRVYQGKRKLCRPIRTAAKHKKVPTESYWLRGAAKKQQNVSPHSTMMGTPIRCGAQARS